MGNPQKYSLTLPITPLANPATSAGGSVPLFGGHRGGGKKRADGLAAGSAAALAEDKRKDNERKSAATATKRRATLPATLPAASAAAVAPLVAGATLLPVVAAGVVVPWTTRLLEKPAKLLTRILDRLRCGQIFAKLDRSKLPAEVTAEIKKEAAWKDAARDDFANSLTECAVIELNKRCVPGAANGHWVTLGISGGELIMAHVDLLARIDKLTAAVETKRGDAETRKEEPA